MSRDDGFNIADVDSAYFDDAKMRALWQRLLDPDRMARAVVLHKATLLASWRHGERVTVTDAAPIWLPAEVELVEHLIAVRLLDRRGRVAVASWEHWFGAAHARREVRREAGRMGGRASGKARSTPAERMPKQPLTLAEPDRPSVPTDRPSVPTRPPTDDGLHHVTRSVADAWEAATGSTFLAGGAFATSYVDDACRRHPTVAVESAIREARRGYSVIPSSQQLASGVRAILDPFKDPKASKQQDAERRDAERGRRAVQATKKRTHDMGYHADEPDPMCDACTGGKAA